MQTIEQTEEPVIVLTEDASLRSRLCAKLVEYKSRLDGYRAPELQMDALCKITVLERLLRDGQVGTHGLSREMARTYGDGFDCRRFENACGVIAYYNGTSDVPVMRGTGLPTV